MGVYPCTSCGALFISVNMTQEPHGPTCPFNEDTQTRAASVVQECRRNGTGDETDAAKGSLVWIGYESMRDAVALLIADTKALLASADQCHDATCGRPATKHQKGNGSWSACDDHAVEVEGGWEEWPWAEAVRRACRSTGPDAKETG